MEIVGANDPPVTPDYLSPEAQIVWQEEVARVMSVGVCELDSSIFGRYCSIEAVVRNVHANGQAAPAAYLTELRRMAELLGIAGPKSRVQKVDQGKSSNPFGKL